MSTSPDPRLAALRALAEKATPGPWHRYKNALYGQVLDANGAEVTMNDEHGACWADDAAFIAAANPAVILSLLDALAAAEGERDQARKTAELDVLHWTEAWEVGDRYRTATRAEIDWLKDEVVALTSERDALAARLAGDRWWSLNENLPSYGQPVWCYWPGARKGEPGMQGCAVRGHRMPNMGVGDWTVGDYWHAEDDCDDTRFAPLAWRQLPAAPSEAGGEGRGTG